MRVFGRRIQFVSWRHYWRVWRLWFRWPANPLIAGSIDLGPLEIRIWRKVKP